MTPHLFEGLYENNSKIGLNLVCSCVHLYVDICSTDVSSSMTPDGRKNIDGRLYETRLSLVMLNPITKK